MLMILGPPIQIGGLFFLSEASIMLPSWSSKMLDLIKLEIIAKIRELAGREGRAPGRELFQAETGIKAHVWRGKIWRQWSDALVEAGFAPNSLQASFTDDELLQPVLLIAKALGRFPSTSDIEFEIRKIPNAPGAKTIFGKWSMGELAVALAVYANRAGEKDVAALAQAYRARTSALKDQGNDSPAIGYVYMQRHGNDFKIGFTASLNKRGRQIQIELPQEIELVHSILTDDPVGVEGYWHKRFASKRTRGEWFKLTKTDVAAFKRWSKIW